MALQRLELRPEKASYRYSINRDVVSSQLEGGLSRRRRDIAGSSSVIKCTWFLKPTDYQYFMAFYHSATQRGAETFLIDLLLEQPFLEEKEAAFIEETLVMKQIGLSFEVSADLETVPFQADDFADVVLILYAEEADSDDFLNAFEQLTNVDLEIA